jgi:hypothetical protein
LTDAERRARNAAHESWWAVPTANALDRATAMMPALLNDRLDEFGIDFTVLYPTQGLGVVGVPDDEMRRAACAAYNTFTADYFADYSHRMPGERGCRRRRTERRRPVPRRPRRSAHRGWLVWRRPPSTDGLERDSDHGAIPGARPRSRDHGISVDIGRWEAATAVLPSVATPLDSWDWSVNVARSRLQFRTRSWVGSIGTSGTPSSAELRRVLGQLASTRTGDVGCGDRR